jgi:hypothetical protein
LASGGVCVVMDRELYCFERSYGHCNNGDVLLCKCSWQNPNLCGYNNLAVWICGVVANTYRFDVGVVDLIHFVICELLFTGC